MALVVVPVSAGREVDDTNPQANPFVLELRTWDRELPRGASIRIDIPPSGYQFWCTYLLDDHPLSSLDPLGGIFPHPPRGRKANYVLAARTQPRPADAGRMSPAMPGPDVSSRTLITDITEITL